MTAYWIGVQLGPNTEMMMVEPLSSGLAGLWAGVSLGGALVAAPAKFRAPSLTRPVALDVGRAQFGWIGITEALLAAAFLVSLTLSTAPDWQWVLAALGLFAVQRLVIMPPLDGRTRRIIAGESLPPSRLHLAFVFAEVVKCLLLTGMAVGVLPLSRA